MRAFLPRSRRSYGARSKKYEAFIDLKDLFIYNSLIIKTMTGTKRNGAHYRERETV